MSFNQASLVHFPFAFHKGTPKIGNGTEYSSGWQNVRGHARIQGHIFADLAPDVGYPVIEFSSNGVDVDVSYVIPQDPAPTPAGFVFKVDYRNLARFVQIRFKHTGAATTLRLEVFGEPTGGGPAS